MTEQIAQECRTCKQPMLETEWGPMCRRALQGWRWTDDHWRRPFAGHPESNPDEIEYLKKHGKPDSVASV